MFFTYSFHSRNNYLGLNVLCIFISLTEQLSRSKCSLHIHFTHGATISFYLFCTYSFHSRSNYLVLNVLYIFISLTEQLSPSKCSLHIHFTPGATISF